MTKEELTTERNEVREILEGFSEELSQSNLDKLSRVFCIINGDEKRITELEEKISILLSCKNCPENKGGFICVKEYENKCLAQKIQYIKELKEENKVLAQNLEDTEILNKTYEKRFNDLEKENAELKDDNKVMADNYSKMEQKFYDNLTKAKDILERLLITSCNSDVLNLLPNCSEVLRVRVEAEQFLSEVKK